MVTKRIQRTRKKGYRLTDFHAFIFSARNKFQLPYARIAGLLKIEYGFEVTGSGVSQYLAKQKAGAAK